jgi:enoyl-CoA hydratase
MTSVPSSGAAAVRTSRLAGTGICELVLDRPPVNALDLATYRSLNCALDELAADPQTTCVLFGSAVPGAFCGGADTRELAAADATNPDGPWAERDALTTRVIDQVHSFPLPLIAVIDGYAIGAGFVLASLCDIRVASHRSWFSIPELSVSRAGGARHALRVLPPGVVRTMYFARTRLSAERASALGFVEELHDAEQVWSVARHLAAVISEVPAELLRDAKTALQQGEELPVAEGVRLERRYSLKFASTQQGSGRDKR